MKDKIEELKEEKNTQKLLDLLDEGDLKEREEAAKALGMIGCEESLPRLVESVKNDPASTVRANAALALSSFEGEKCKKALENAADDEDWKVRHDAAIAMGDFKEKCFEETLCSLIKDSEKEVRKKAIDSLGKIAEEDKISELESFLENESLKINAVKAISEIGTEEAVEPLEEAYYDGEMEIREIAVKGLGNIQSEEPTKIILDALKDDSWRIREEAAKILGKKGDEDHVEPLLERLGDRNSYVVEAALRALGTIDGQEVLQHIKENMYSDEPGVRIAAAEALEILDSEKSAQTLLELLRDEKNPRVLWSVSDSLSVFSKGTLEEIESDIDLIPEDKKIFTSVSMTKAGFSSYAKESVDALNSERWKIRQKAAEALESVDPAELNKRTRKQLFKALRKGLGDNDKWVKARSIRTLARLTHRVEEDIGQEEIKEEIMEMERTEVDKDVLEALKDAERLLD